MEVSFFLSETEECKTNIEQLDISNESSTEEVLNSMILLNDQFKTSFIHTYLSEKTEIHVTVLLILSRRFALRNVSNISAVG